MSKEDEFADVEPEVNPGPPQDIRNIGCYLFTTPVNAATVRPVIEWILIENLAEQRRDFLQLFINSPGGAIHDCFALTDVMEASAVPIRTTGIGLIASCGLLIFMAGQKGHRVVTPNTFILTHQFSAGVGGKEHELIAARRQWEMTGKRLIAHYKRHTKLSVAKIRKELMPPGDRWLTARQAIKFNLVDKIKKLGR